MRAVLDIGCGFADLYGYIRQHQLDLTYKGIDINPNFLLVAKEIFGDGLNVDCVNILDVIVTVNYLIGHIDLNTVQLQNADMNLDGTINVLDILMIVDMVLENQ